MLKHSSPTRSRRVLGRSLVVVAGLCGAYVAWAVQTPRVAAVPSAARQVEAVLSIELGGAKQDVRLVNPEGRPFSVRNDDPAHPWQAQFTAHDVEGGHIRLDGTISDRGRVIGQPELVVEQGQPATMQLGDDGAGHAYRIEATLWLHDGSWKPNADVQLVSPEPAANAG